MKKYILNIIAINLMLFAFSGSLFSQLPAVIKGEVRVESMTSVPSGITITIAETTNFTSPNPSGIYTLNATPGVQITIVASLAGYADIEKTITPAATLTPGLSNYVDFWFNPPPQVISDYDGNLYNTVIIGSQVWMAENLKVTHFNNGNSIQYVSDPAVWTSELTNPSTKFCYYNNNGDVNRFDYGALYNYYSAASGNLCPVGWHTATETDWVELEGFIGGNGSMLKETGITHWPEPNYSNNETGFTALPGGNRSPTDGTFASLGLLGLWWSTGSLVPYFKGLTYNSDEIVTNNTLRNHGISVRCVQNMIPQLTTTAVTTGTTTTAISGGNITYDGGTPITSRGVCWNNYPGPSTSNRYTTAGQGSGLFTCEITGLSPDSIYYVRAFAVNSKGLSYGNEISFTTSANPPIVISTSVNPGSTSAILIGVVNANSLNTSVTFEYGTDISYGINIPAEPGTISGSNNTSIIGRLADLTPGNIYHFRITAENSDGTITGPDLTFTTPAKVNDIDNNSYNTVEIGDQLWFQENLKTTHYRNGDELIYSTDWASLGNSTDGAYCNYDYNPDNADIYGRLYNYFATVDNRNLCPTGWHVATNVEWEVLENYLIENGYNWDGTTAGNKVAKSLASVEGWAFSDNEGAVGNPAHPEYMNKSGYSGLPGGYVYTDGIFRSFGDGEVWWTSTQKSITESIAASIWSISDILVRSIEGSEPGNDLKARGFSVRCIQGEGQVLPAVTTTKFTEVSSSSVTTGGEITADGESSVTERGVCWSTSHNPTIADNTTSDGSGLGPFSSNINELLPETTYYVRAYATNSVGTAYGNEIVLRTYNPAIISDRNGNLYNTVTIGDQTWMVQNLKSTTYNDGSPIDNPGSDNNLWESNTTGAYCWYSDDEASYKEPYGALYNWYSVNTGKLCPTGWHVPTDNEWTILTDYLGGTAEAGGKLKETGTIHWTDPNEGATNETGFTAVGGGYRDTDLDIFTNINNTAHFWSSTENNVYGLGRSLYWSYTRVDPSLTPKNFGYSVRCIENNTITVTNVSDAGPGSLRQAILDANSIPGIDNIAFDIPGAEISSIQPLDQLPAITDPVIIDGYTQSGSAEAADGVPATLLIELNGTSAGAGASGIFIETNNCEIKGLVINRFANSGIRIEGEGISGNKISGNFIGTTTDGESAAGNLVFGIYNKANNTLISGNVISGNGGLEQNPGLAIAEGSTGTKVFGNFIGTNSEGSSAIKNSGSGINIGDSPDNIIGGLREGEKNIIFDGIQITGEASTGNIISGNFIGFNIEGESVLRDGTGIVLYNGPSINDIGPLNVISGISIGNAISIQNASTHNNNVFGNLIGVTPDGISALSNNNAGIEISDSPGNIIGGLSPVDKNVISGSLNYNNGLNIGGLSSTGNQVLGNFIGTDISGNFAIGNAGGGVGLNNGANQNIIGPKNVISGNKEHGIHFEDEITSGNKIIGNLIGTTENGMTGLGNQTHGVWMNASNNTIGGTTIEERNVISANGFGVEIGSQNVTGNIIKGNYLGTDITGNGALLNIDGDLSLNNSSWSVVGGLEPGAGNIIGSIGIGNEGAQNNQVIGNYIGIKADGTGPISTNYNKSGISLTDASNNTIGPGNVISGNDVGIFITTSEDGDIEASNGNRIIGNRIGTNSEGKGPIANKSAGIEIERAHGTIIGGSESAERNVVSGNELYGIFLINDASKNYIRGNFIGIDVTGNNKLANGIGIHVVSSKNNIIGGSLPGEGNTVSGNSSTGLLIRNEIIGEINTISEGNKVIGNLIGINDQNNPNIGNDGHGISIGSISKDNYIGGTKPEERNVIGGNGGNGIDLHGSGCTENFIVGNYIGTDISGKNPIPNSGGIGTSDGSTKNHIGESSDGSGNLIAFNKDVGIWLLSDANFVEGNEIHGHTVDEIFINGSYNLIGGSTPEGRNYLYGDHHGIRTSEQANNNHIEGNYFGISRSGDTDMTDGYDGVGISGNDNILIKNVISGYNQGHGVYVYRWSPTSTIPSGNIIQENKIGLTASGIDFIPNQNGISINSAVNTKIINNTIAGNQYDAIHIADDFFIAGDPIQHSVGNLISQNSIYSNGQVAINLMAEGEYEWLTQNDIGDGDEGPNQLQNFPILGSISFSPGEVNITGTLNSMPGRVYTIEFFASLQPDNVTYSDGKHYGEGQTYLGTETVITDASGNASFTFSFPIKSGDGQIITATATDLEGNTSEFSNAIGGLADQEVGTEWPIHYRYNELGVENITDGSDVSAIENAFQTWSDVATADIEFVSDGSTEAKYASADDGVNLVSFVDDQFPWTKGVLAYAAKTIRMDDNDNQAQIIDADIIVNPDFVNSLTGTLGVAEEGGTPGYYDIQSVLTHEIGHLLGLIHTGVVDGTMFFWLWDGDTKVRSLEADDKAWVSYKYPGDNYAVTYGTLTGSITYGYDPFPNVAGALVTARNSEGVQFHAYSDADGNFTIPVERNNSYTIAIQPLDGDVNGYPMQPRNISSYIYSNTIYVDYPDEYYSGVQGELEESVNGMDQAAELVDLNYGPMNITTNPDLTPPDVVTITPKPEDQPVKILPDIIIQFSEPIEITTLSDETCWLESAGNIFYGSFTELGGSSDLILFTPDEPLEYDTEYDLHLGVYLDDNTPCITDLKGNGLETYSSYSIITIQSDDAKPEISGIIPENEAEGVFVTDKIMIFFSEPMNKLSVESAFTLSCMGNSDVEGSFSWKNENTLMVFTPLNSLLESTHYTVSFSGEITDLSHNAMDPVTPAIFMTVLAAEPQIIYMEPGNEITDNVSITTPIVVDFSEPIDPSTINSSTFYVHSADGTQVQGNFEFLCDNSRIIFRPDADLQFSMDYTIELTEGIKDVSPVSLNFDPSQIKDDGTGNSWIPATFTTADEQSTPDIYYLDPPASVSGALVTIEGEGFDPDPSDNYVVFGDMPATVKRANLTTLVVEVPKGVLSGMVYVTVNGRTTDPGYYFYVIPQSLDPCEIVLTGTNTGSRSRDVEVTGEGATAYVTNPGSNSISVIDLATLAPDPRYDPITIGIGSSPLKIDINPAGTRAYVTNFGSHTVSVIDLTEGDTKNQVIDEINVGINPYGVVVTPNGDMIYVSNYSSNNLSVIDADPNSGGFDHVVASVNTGTRNKDIIVTGDAGLVLVAGDNGLTIINSDPEDEDYNCVIANSSSGTRTRDVDVSGDAGVAFVTTEDGQLLVIDIVPQSDFFGAVLASAGSASKVKDVTVSGESIHVYVTTEDNKVLVYQFNQTGTALPGGSYAGTPTLTLHATIDYLKVGNEGLVVDAKSETLYTVNSDYENGLGALIPIKICCGPITPENAIGNLIIRIENMINGGAIMESLGDELIHKLNQTLDDLSEDKIKQAINDLKSFITKVQDFTRSGKITTDQGQVLIDAANEIIALLKGTKSVTEDNQIADLQLPYYNSSINESKLGTIYPNPFSESITINYEVAESETGYEKVQIYIYDVIGRLVGTVVDREMLPGIYSVVWNGKYDSGGHVPKGTYFIQFRTDTKREVKRIMLIR